MFITQALKRSAHLYSDRLATVCQGRERTWSEVEARVAKFAGALRKLGVENGERVAILSLNSDRYYEYFFATPVGWRRVRADQHPASATGSCLLAERFR